jgi:phage gp36-like protein
VAYCLQADVLLACDGAEELIQLADRDHDGVADTAVVTRAIERADSYMNGYIAKQYATPIAADQVTPELKHRSAELAVYYLRKDKRALTEEDRDFYDSTEKWLEQIAAGKVSLDADPLPTAHSTRIDQVTTSGDSISELRSKYRGFW